MENAINALCFARNLASNCDFPKIKDGKYLARENRIDFPVGPREFVGNRSMRPVFAAFYQLSSLTVTNQPNRRIHVEEGMEDFYRLNLT